MSDNLEKETFSSTESMSEKVESAESRDIVASDEQWEDANAGFLAAALEWLRLSLQLMVKNASDAELHVTLVETSATDDNESGRFGRSRQRSDRQQESTPAGRRVNSESILAASERMELARSNDTLPALRILSERFGLTRFEENILLLCAAMELDTRIATLCAQAQGDTRPYPTFALAMTLFEGVAWSAMSPERPLRLWRLLTINQRSGEPLTTSALCADGRIVSFIKGLNYLDHRLAPMLVPFDIPRELQEDLPRSQQRVVESVIDYLNRGGVGTVSPIVQLVGSDPYSRQLIARNIAVRMRLNAYRMPADHLPKEPAELTALSRLWQRESILLPILLFLDADVADGTSGDGDEREAGGAMRRFLARTGGIFLVGTRDVIPRLGSSSISVDANKPLALEQRVAWQESSVGLDANDASILVGQFDLNIATIHTIARMVVDDDNEHERLGKVWKACLNVTQPRLDLLAQRVEPKAGWADIVLADEARRLLMEVAHQVRARSHVYDDWGFRSRMSRGLGISALFAGESGTGKTMAAEVLARELALNLYRIDLSAVVSKYIGETEKNLRQLFDAAEDGGAILFFDEADALFGKRSEVKDSHDRYANIEVNYLLQRMEAFEGLAILATNLRSALDSAFVRRLRFIINFPFPTAEQRAEMWRRMFPPQAPVATLDYARLGGLNLTGGSIHNVALNASFVAARSSSEITMPLVLEAARTEFQKMEKPIKESEFCWARP